MKNCKHQPHMKRFQVDYPTVLWRVLISGGASMFAIIETGGKQLKVEEGQTIYVEKLDVTEGDTFTFDKVLMVGGDTVKVGAPFVDGAKVTAKVEKQGKAKKVMIIKFKRRKNYSRKQGHRQPFTKLTIDKIDA